MKNKMKTNIRHSKILAVFILLIIGITLILLAWMQACQKSFNGQNASTTVLEYDGSPTHTYFVNINVGNLSVDVGQAIFATPTIYRGSLLVSTMGNETDLNNSRYDLTYGELFRINLTTGKIVWSIKFPDQIMSQPITVGNIIIVAMGNNLEVPPQYYNTKYGIYAVDFNTGKVLWNDTTQITNMPTPAFYKGVIIEPNEGEINIINVSNGQIVKTIFLGIPDTLSSPMIYNNTAYFGTCEASVYGFNATNFKQKDVETNCWFFALDLRNYSIKWKTHFPYAGGGLNDVSPAYWQGKVITGYLFESDYEDPVMVAMNSSTGKIIWEVNTTQINYTIQPSIPPCIPFWYNQNAISPITVINGTAYFDSNFDGRLVAVNITSGKLEWALSTGGQTESNPNTFYGGKYLIIANDYGDMFVINTTTGNPLNVFCTHIPHLENEVVITNNSAILAGMNGEIKAYPLKSLIGENQ